MTYTKCVRMHGVQGNGGVDQGLALGHGRGLDAHIHDIGAKPLARQFKGRLGAGGRLEEQIDQGAPAQLLDLFVVGTALGDIGIGQIQQGGDMGGRKAFDPQQVLGRKDRGVAHQSPAYTGGAGGGQGPVRFINDL